MANNIELTVNKPIKKTKTSPINIELTAHLTGTQDEGVIVNNKRTVLSINVEQPITIEKNKTNKGTENDKKRLTIDYSGIDKIPGDSSSANVEQNKKQTLFINLGEPYPETKPSGDGKDEASHIEINIENLPIFVGGKIDVEIINPPTRQKIKDNQGNPIEIQLYYRLLTMYLHTYDVTCHWVSTNTDVATIDDNGLLHMNDVGQTTIKLEIIYNKDTSKRGYAEFLLTAVKRGFTYTFNFQLS